MVFELLGPNLEDLFCYYDQRFSLKTVLMLADQLLYRFESLHAIDFLHRDVKPENFLLGRGVHGNTVYMTDFGLATYHNNALVANMPPKVISRRHQPQESRLVGTCRYASINAHQGLCEYSPA
jgi:serine/threonine protein kinase